MAGVKTKRGGAAKPPVWKVQNCTECHKVIDYTDSKRQVFPAQRVQAIMFDGPKVQKRYQWRHKTCA